ncbi:MAG TPA: hypothetical protein VKC89_00120 [Patescibacteria group bacterium]|nr:hypothetical protein [Patescibacteria group bacterium]
MGAEREIPLFPGFNRPFVPSVDSPVYNVKVSELVKFSANERRQKLSQGAFRIEVDIPSVKITRNWRAEKNVRHLINGSVNPLAELVSDSWIEMSYFTQFGDEKGPYPIPQGSVIDGHAVSVKNHGAHSAFDRVSPPPRAK